MLRVQVKVHERRRRKSVLFFMDSLLYIFVLVLLNHHHCSGVGVPSNLNSKDNLWQELISAKDSILTVASQLEKFNTMYLMKLEQRMMLTASTLASIDSNVKNLQERAHVWDTFQLHVSAWNEQINTLDKKVEIISKGQEKMLSLDAKINSISNIEYKTERIVGKLDEQSSTIQTIIKLIENQNTGPLFGEFTTRGVLSTLKLIERKMDKLQSKPIGNENDQKLVIKCNSPPVVEELLNDIASKVDVLFDKFSNNFSEQSDEPNPDDEGDSSQETKSDSDLKLMKGLLKRLNQPCKRTVKVLENLETYIKDIDNKTSQLLEGENKLNQVLNAFGSNDTKIEALFNSNQTKDVEERFDQLQNVLTEQLQELRIELQICTNPITTLTSTSTSISTTTELPIIQAQELIPVKYSDKKGCDELNWSEPKGVYIFENETNRSYNHRYCENRLDGPLWTVVQRRGINPLEQTFNRTWTDYKQGFGALDKDFWFGNDFLHRLVNEKPNLLRIELEDFNGNFVWAEYNTFQVANEDENYRLRVGDYRGNASDSFSAHDNASFSTFDRANDAAPECCPCALSFGGGWWFYSCFEANLNGIYYTNPYTNEYFRGLIWEHWLGNYSLKKTQMMIRPKTNNYEPGSGLDLNQDDPYEIPEDP